MSAPENVAMVPGENSAGMDTVKKFVLQVGLRGEDAKRMIVTLKGAVDRTATAARDGTIPPRDNIRLGGPWKPP